MVKQPNRISPKVLTTMGAQQTLEPDYGRSHLPSSILHFDPVCAHSLEWHLGSVCQPSIHCNWDFSGSHLSGQWRWVCIPNACDGYLQLSPPLASSCASQIDCGGLLSHCGWLGDQLLSILNAWTLAHCRMRGYQRALVAIIKGACFVVMVDHIETYLIITCNERSNCLESPTPCKLARACNNLEVQLLLSILCQRFWFIFLLPDVAWNCPIVQRYFSVLTLFLVDLIMLSARWLPLKKALRFPWTLINFLLSLDCVIGERYNHYSGLMKWRTCRKGTTIPLRLWIVHYLYGT